MTKTVGSKFQLQLTKMLFLVENRKKSTLQLNSACSNQSSLELAYVKIQLSMFKKDFPFKNRKSEHNH